LKTRRLKSALVVALIFAVAALGLVLTRRSAHTLISDAKPLADASGWNAFYYRWQSTDRLIALREDGNRYRAVYINGTTGAQTDATAITNRIVTRHPGWAFGGWLVSEDGKWLLRQRYKNNRWIWMAAEIYGNRTLERPMPVGAYAPANPGWRAWLPDSRHWAEVRNVNNSLVGNIFSVDTPEVRTFPLAAPAAAFSTARGNSLAPIGFTPPRHALMADWYPGQIVDILVYDFDLDKPAALPRQFTLKRPADSRIDELHLSPNGDRIAWLLYCEHSPFIARYFGRWMPRPDSTVELWVSRLDGTGTRLVGSQPVAHNLGPQKDCPQQVRWAPDGKRLSFLYGKKLYIIQAT
jgi:hypothetical protein